MPDPTPDPFSALVRALAGIDQAAAGQVRARLLAELAPVINQDAPDPEADEALSCWLAPVLQALNR